MTMWSYADWAYWIYCCFVQTKLSTHFSQNTKMQLLALKSMCTTLNQFHCRAFSPVTMVMKFHQFIEQTIAWSRLIVFAWVFQCLFWLYTAATSCCRVLFMWQTVPRLPESDRCTLKGRLSRQSRTVPGEDDALWKDAISKKLSVWWSLQPCTAGKFLWKLFLFTSIPVFITPDITAFLL